MVAGKNNAQALARSAGAPKLPPLPKLRVRKPDRADANPCIGVMSSVLGCWASQGYSAQGCAMLEQQLRACMDARKPQETKKSNINYHLSRFYPQIVGPHKRK
ncbi:hypothetical protein KC367_g1531 [Hortaea werneckii]|uniref:Small ribosomal subunit protein mS37 n=2 Tax=Hortaea werneckii TaxID=91943 RepID=A0A1Z5TL86_HORWE|nr:hypothetical protein KC361_g168 [Hortaea werneckii]OTA33009.1 hypothetical protein BTJ68_07171 [Hortaea werneckii EXF-2000]KAI6818798.1 hypothetical protein KC358_g9931 [Hortaea werneckii]KAI6818895.1 hypothetical protein KC358_g9895 [Hortaea werneckii]KAI6822292.1 hypothetical protein KC350_g9402 [Hortaea werneckii]